MLFGLLSIFVLAVSAAPIFGGLFGGPQGSSKANPIKLTITPDGNVYNDGDLIGAIIQTPKETFFLAQDGADSFTGKHRRQPIDEEGWVEYDVGYGKPRLIGRFPGWYELVRNARFADEAYTRFLHSNIKQARLLRGNSPKTEQSYDAILERYANGPDAWNRAMYPVKAETAQQVGGPISSSSEGTIEPGKPGGLSELNVKPAVSEGASGGTVIGGIEEPNGLGRGTTEIL